MAWLTTRWELNLTREPFDRPRGAAAQAKGVGLLQVGEGPCYVFYKPYHLPHIQIASTIARAALFGDPTVTPLGAPVCEVITIAKRNLQVGEVLDGVGGLMVYGVIENAPIRATQNLLPMGVSEGCRLLRNISKDQPITYADIELPQDRLCDRLRAQQYRHFSGETAGRRDQEPQLTRSLFQTYSASTTRKEIMKVVLFCGGLECASVMRKIFRSPWCTSASGQSCGT